MPLLKKIQKEYDKNIRPYVFHVNLADGRSFSFNFKKDNLKHLLGLQYIYDESWPGGVIYQKIKKGKITLKTIQSFPAYNGIENRILNFSRIKDLFETDKLIEFDVTKLKNCSLKTKFMFFNSTSGETLHLGIAEDGSYYPETWFIRTQDKDKYIKNQAIITIDNIIKKIKT